MPDDTLWAIQPHTAAKHAIVRRHLGAWYPKLAWTRHVVVVDGFAGPGEYIGGEPGSPVVALQTALEHTRDLSTCRLDFVFIEERIDRHTHLVDVLGRLGAMPANVHVRVIHGEFELEVEKALADVKATSDTPVFLMVDPFGPSGLPYKLIRRLAGRRRVDLLLSFMYGTMTRWLDQPNYERPMTELFGDDTWRKAVDLEGEPRRAYLHGRYQEVLRSGGFSKVGSFELLDGGNATEYYLMFAGHHIEALKAIKAAMWAVDPEGGQRFSDKADATLLQQPKLLAREPDGDRLRREVVARFGGLEATVDEVEEFVLESTIFRETHVRQYALAPLEAAARIEHVLTPNRRRGRTYPSGTRIRFAS